MSLFRPNIPTYSIGGGSGEHGNGHENSMISSHSRPSVSYFLMDRYRGNSSHSGGGLIINRCSDLTQKLFQKNVLGPQKRGTGSDFYMMEGGKNSGIMHGPTSNNSINSNLSHISNNGMLITPIEDLMQAQYHNMQNQ
jgi:hypothetical protein